VIAFGQGGLLETVRGLDQPQPTGLFFEEQHEASIVAAIEQFERLTVPLTADNCIANARRFAPERFRAEFSDFVEQVMLSRWKGGRSWSMPPPAPAGRAEQPQAAFAAVPKMP
jgi:hypothetical protein